jgi:hypothetical protein
MAALCGLYSAFTIVLTLDHPGATSAALALATFVGAAFAIRWRSPWLVAAPAVTAVGLVLSALLWLNAPRPALGPGVLALGLALWTAGLLVRGDYGTPLRLVGAVAALLSFGLGVASEIVHTGPTFNWSAHLDSLTLLCLAAWIAWESTAHRLLLYLASLVLMSGLLWELWALGVDSVQAYAVPLGLYFVLAGLAAGADTRLGGAQGPVSALAWTLSGLAFGLPTLAQSFGDHAIRYCVVLLGESFVLILLGLVTKRRGLLAVSTTFVILAGLRMVFQNPNLILPALVTASCTFFSVGIGVLIYYGVKRQRAEKSGETAGPPHHHSRSET